MSDQVPGVPSEPTPEPATPGPGPSGETPVIQSQEERTMGMLCHLLGFAFIAAGIGNILGPLILWLVKKDQMPFVDDQGKESLNFQISITIYWIVAALLSFALIGIPLLIAVAVFDIVEIIMASVKANQGIPYRYPVTIRFIK